MTTLAKSVSLNPGQSQQVTFEVRPQEAGVYGVNVDGLTGSFTAKPPLGEGEKTIQVIDLKWVESPPFIGGDTYHYDLTLRNLWSEPETATVGLWKEPWGREGGWNHCKLEGFEQKTFLCGANTPAEEGRYWAYLKLCAFDKVNYLTQVGLIQEVIQNPDALIPLGAPPSYPNWSGLKDFPVPSTHWPSSIYAETIRLPMVSRSHSTEGELVVKLLSPLDYYQLPGVFRIGGTEQRYVDGKPPKSATLYMYQIWLDYGQMESVLLTTSDPSSLYTLPVVFPKTTKSVGRYPITFRMSVMGGGAFGYFMWSPEPRRFHRDVLLGYINVGA